MGDWQEAMEESDQLPAWPYQVRYGKVNQVRADILILGGGVAGCYAAITASAKGSSVVIVEKGSTVASGSGGAGIDHWVNACTSPCCKVSPKEMTEAIMECNEGWDIGLKHYIHCKESYDALLEMEKMGVEFRDVEDEFKGAEFRDEKTKLLFAYDYENKFTIRARGGAKVKSALYKEVKRLGVGIYDRIMVTSLLTEGGRPGSRVIGATGVNVRTGEFYVFTGKATVTCMGSAHRLWVFSTELRGLASCFFDPNCVGDGFAMAWRAGAEFTMLEKSQAVAGGFAYPAYGVGSAANTWYACTIVDSNGKEVPWVDRDGRVLKQVSERYRPVSGQKFFLNSPYLLAPPDSPSIYKYKGPSLIRDLPDRIKKGEFVLPLHADLPSMPPHERRAIFGLMVGNEGKTRIPIYGTYTKNGFDPEKDMLQVPVLIGGYVAPSQAGSVSPAPWRDIPPPFGGAGLIVNWDLKTNLEGLYAAGMSLPGGSVFSGAAATGRYAARNAVEYSRNAHDPIVNMAQVEAEKKRVYAPVKRQDGIGWKELDAGICRIMQDYCGAVKTEETLRTGLKWFNSIKENEAAVTYARNPHELMRCLECFSRVTVGEMMINACLARRASSRVLNFERLDYPEVDPPEWKTFITIKQENEMAKIGKLPFNYWLQPPYAPTYEENYKLHSCL